MGLIGLAPSALAQKWEFGGGIGGSFYPSRDVTNGSTSASAGIRTNVASGVWLGQNGSNKWGGEIRFDYQLGDLSLERSLELFERGMGLSDSCRKQLEEAETRVEVLIRNAGKITAEPFRPDKS